jgi:hypothetical protein
MTKEDKLIKCIRGLLDKNMKEAAHSNNKTLLQSIKELIPDYTGPTIA